jgi:hypothetical protein
VQRYPDDTRRAPAKPPAQPVGMAESKRKRTSWQKPACYTSVQGGFCSSGCLYALTTWPDQVLGCLHFHARLSTAHSGALPSPSDLPSPPGRLSRECIAGKSAGSFSRPRLSNPIVTSPDDSHLGSACNGK